MGTVEISEAFLAKIAGWEAMKRARATMEMDKVLSSHWMPPVLRGVVQDGSISYRAGLVIKDAIDIENLCGCRESRQYGTMCAHSVAVGLHYLRGLQPPKTAASSSPSDPGRPASALNTVPSPALSTEVRRLKRAATPAQGETLRLQVILPPNLAQAMSKGIIMVCVEAEWRNRRIPLNSVDRHVPMAVATEDEILLTHLEDLAGEPPTMLQLRADDFAALLNLLANHPRVSLGKTRTVQVLSQPWPVPITATLAAEGEIILALKQEAPTPAQKAFGLLHANAGWIFHDDVLQAIALPPRCRTLFSGPVRIPRSEVPLFLSQDWPLLNKNARLDANFKLDDFTLSPAPPRFVLSLSGGLAQLQAQLQCAYGPRVMTLGVTSADESFWLPDPADPTRYATRDAVAEKAAIARLLRAGFTGPDAQGHWQLLGQNNVFNFLARDYARLQREWEVTLEQRLEKSVAANIERVEPAFTVTPSGQNWFDLQIDYRTSSGQPLDAAEIQRLVLSGQSYRRMSNGKVAIIDTGAVADLQEALVDCAPEQRSGVYRLASAQAGFLAATAQAHQGWKFDAPEAWKNRLALGAQAQRCPPLGELEAVLRPYQKDGVAWLHFLSANEFGGILADEMGLGKTLQLLAFLQSLSPDSKRPSLVICPTSLVYNWVSEAKRFTPALRVLALHGPDRLDRFKDLPSANLVVTSYALIRRDADLYRDHEFEIVALDEAQHIKNRQTQNAQAVKSIRARHRFVLTGTPMENSVLDLWSIFDFLMPGYLGNAKDFHERYELAITRDKDAAAQQRLTRRIRPFLLRRLKKEVARDLPEKIDQTAFCDLTDQQAAVYQQVLEAGRQEIVTAVESQGLAKSRMLIFTTLLRLRQVCCDLRLLHLSQLDLDQASGKTDLFHELLEEVIDGGHRVLVFSQFTSMLALLKETLAAEGVDYCYLDGSTTNRSEVIERFQKQLDIPVFLLSLKAGGVGLNLTGADTVIHFDPWWNPAVEDQATDRAHRIGQTRVVTSYKLITRGTVEEKILSLQARKRELIQSALGDEESLSKMLSWEEILELMG